MTIEFTDRYQAVGMPYPSRLSVCSGQCDGMGCVPVDAPPDSHWAKQHPKSYRAIEPDPAYVRAWYLAEAAQPTDDGWHFVRCLTCNGTGREPGSRTLVAIRRLPREIRRSAHFCRDMLFRFEVSDMTAPRARRRHMWLVLKITFGWKPSAR